MSHRPRVLHLVTSLTAEAGGIQVLLTRLLPRLSGQFDQEIMTLTVSEYFGSTLDSTDVPVRFFSSGGASRSERVDRLAEEFSRLRLDIVHAHDRFPCVIGMEAARRAGIPGRVAHHHTPHAWLEDKPGVAAREFASVRHASRLLFCSTAVRDDVLGRVPRLAGMRMEILPNPVDLEQFHRGAASGSAGESRPLPRVGMVGRITPEKNQAMLIEAAGLLRAEGFPIDVLLVGKVEPGYLAELQAETERLGLSDRIQFRGHHPDPSDLLRSLDLSVNCSRFEGMSMVVLESWASGVPVVATRVPGLREMIRDGVDGVLCEADAGSLAAAIRRVLEDRALRASLVRHGLERAEEYSTLRIAARLGEIYGKILAESDG